MCGLWLVACGLWLVACGLRLARSTTLPDMPEHPTNAQEQSALLVEARQHVQALSASLPTIIDAGSFRTSSGEICGSKAPTIALSFRETQAWRVEEFSRAACDMIERGDLVVGVANVRHVIESCAAVWYLLDLIERHTKTGIDHKELYDRLGKLFLGSKNVFPDMPRAVNVMTFIEKMDKVHPGVARNYDQLSEISHPNWAGSVAMFANRSEDNFTTYFGRSLRGHSATQNMALSSLIDGMEIFTHAYNRITDLVPNFVDACARSSSSNSPPA